MRGRNSILFLGLMGSLAWGGPGSYLYLQPVQIQFDDGKVVTIPGRISERDDGSIQISEDGRQGSLEAEGIQVIQVPVEQGADHLTALLQSSAPDPAPDLHDHLRIWMFSPRADPQLPADFIPTVWTGIRVHLGPVKNKIATARQVFAVVQRLGVTTQAALAILPTRHHIALATLPSTTSTTKSFFLEKREWEVRESLMARLPADQRLALETLIAREQRAEARARLKARTLRFFRWAALSAVAITPGLSAHFWAHQPENPDAWGAPAIRQFEETLTEAFRDCLRDFPKLR